MGRSLGCTFSHSPEVLATLDGAAIGGVDVLGGPDDGEGHRGREEAGVFGVLLIIGLDGRGVDSDALGGNNVSDLGKDVREDENMG